MQSQRPTDRHLVALTEQCAYHLLGRTCIGVIDRRNGRWLRDHPVVEAPLRGALRGGDHGDPTTPGFHIGEQLVFDVAGGQHVSGEVLAVEQPAPLRSQQLLADARGESGVRPLPAHSPWHRLRRVLSA